MLGSIIWLKLIPMPRRHSERPSRTQDHHLRLSVAGIKLPRRFRRGRKRYHPPLLVHGSDHPMRHWLAAAIVGCLVLSSPGQSLAESQTVTKITPEQFTAILKRAGYPSSVRQSDNQKFVLTKMQDYAVYVQFYDCDSKGCPAIQFWVKFAKDDAMTINYANAWNNQYRFAKAVIAPDGGLIFELDATFVDGVTQGHIEETCKLFDVLLDEFNGFHYP